MFSIVAPYMGAWIEIMIIMELRYLIASHPTWVRGLKFPEREYLAQDCVAPYMGAWIEIRPCSC